MNTPETTNPTGSPETPIANTQPATEIIYGPKPGAVDETLYLTEELAAWIRISPAAIEKDRSLGRGCYTFRQGRRTPNLLPTWRHHGLAPCPSLQP